MGDDIQTFNEMVICRGRRYELIPEIYWHFTAPSNSILLNNIGIEEGRILTMSLVARMPGLENAVTTYSMKAMDDSKETVWERVRSEEYPHRPTRLKALFLFNEREIGDEILNLWFGGEERIALQVRVIAGGTVAGADARWLETKEAEWEESARKYWEGKPTDNPLPEIILDGQAYFPEWREYAQPRR